MERNPHIFKALIDTVPSPIFFKGVDGRYLGCNRAFERYLGRTREAIIGKTDLDLAPPELARLNKLKDDELFANPGAQEYEAKVKSADGAGHDVVFHKTTFDDESGMLAGLIGVIQDVPDGGRDQDRAPVSGSQSGGILELLQDIYFQVALDGTFELISPSGYERTGYRPGELIGRNIAEIFADPAELAELIAQLGKNHAVSDYEIKFRNRNGEIRQGALSARIIFDPHGNPAAIEGAVRDSEAYRRAEQNLGYSEQRFQQIAGCNSDWVWETGAEGLYIYSNAAAEGIMGYRPDELVGSKLFYELFAPGMPDGLRETARAKFTRHEAITAFVHPCRRKDGSEVLLETSAVPYFSPAGAFLGYRGASRDVSLRKTLEEEREWLTAELQKSLESIKALKSLVPVCFSCRKIRDDKEYWQQVEAYVGQHSEVESAHGLCGECARKLYPE